MGTSNYGDEFKRDAVHGYPVLEVSRRLGVSSHSLYKWMKLFCRACFKIGWHGSRSGEPSAEAGARPCDRGAQHSRKG
jgi:transposase-like protein